MTPMRPAWLLVIFGASALAGFLAAHLTAAVGISSPVLPIISVITFVGLGVLLLALGLVVRSDQRRIERAAHEAGLKNEEPRHPARRLHPLQALRVAVAGQAAAYAGALIAGWHAGVLLDLAPAGGLGTPNVSAAVVIGLAGAGWVVVGAVVERLCRIPPDTGAGGGGTLADEKNTEDGNEGYAL
ncbi:DUF3180 family protein [Nesterenkonia populi]|uniref:DUF3180 family protein n=1 Tax=Nesterenkonia populi TaxID=1591087 RepID=UPI0011BDE198|nr:DUF3180 family protein [Nesterenkonia populi]